MNKFRQLSIRTPAILKTAWLLFVCALPLLSLLTMNAGCRSVPEAPVIRASVYSTPENWFVSQHYPALQPRRVVIVSPQNQSGSLAEQERFAAELAVELRGHGVTDAVVGGAKMACSTDAIREGRLDEYQLVSLAEAYNADAVIYCDVHSMSPYSPLQASVSISMVDARESVLLLAVDGVWDLRDEQTVQSFRAFVHREPRGDSDAEPEDDLYLQSPTEFIKYVARDVAGFVSSAR